MSSGFRTQYHYLSILRTIDIASGRPKSLPRLFRPKFPNHHLRPGDRAQSRTHTTRRHPLQSSIGDVLLTPPGFPGQAILRSIQRHACRTTNTSPGQRVLSDALPCVFVSVFGIQGRKTQQIRPALNSPFTIHATGPTYKSMYAQHHLLQHGHNLSTRIS